MSKVQMLRVFVNQRLTAAAEEIFELFERTILEYEEQLCGSKESQHKQLTNYRADAQQLLASKEGDSLELQERNSSLNQYNTPEPPIIKEEQEDLWSSREGEQLQGLKEAGINTLIITPVPVKSEEEGDGEELQSSQLYENQTKEDIDTEFLKTEAGGEDCGESGPDFNPDSYLQPITDEETSESETDSSKDWETRPEAGLTTLQNSEAPVSDGYVTEKTSVSLSGCATSSGQKNQQHKHNRIQRNEKTFSCSVCGTRFSKKKYLAVHMMYHTKEKNFSCSVCKRKFLWRARLEEHMRIHTGDKPFSCSLCDKSFTKKSNLYQHQKVHTGEKPFNCSVCGKSFTMKSNFYHHQQVHTGEKPYRCSICETSFLRKTNLVRHMRVHTGEKPFSCSICGRGFKQKSTLCRHQQVHTGEKPFSCPICNISVGRKTQLEVHMRIHTGEKPFSCSVCGKRFTERRGLKRHAGAHSEETSQVTEVGIEDLPDFSISNNEKSCKTE